MSSPTPTPPPPCSVGKSETPPPAVTGNVLTAAPGERNARSLLDADEFMTVTATLARNELNFDRVYAQQVIVETLKFVVAAGESDERLAPSAIIDKGFHALLEKTEIHHAVGARLGVFVHHYPAVSGSAPIAPGWLQRTVDAIRRAGFAEEKDMWA
ncbi:MULTISPECIES: hypothetical protein [unclassified Streptomyces]|uniref:hypothetical protein n=1 Tax=unclassified Streptomyces TaxID=2593676 RepID=UPI000DC7B743|nr:MULTISPECIES: hypothetical protein [unclassified Streptomyces]AWZ07433.1 hypothetical protein DRB89_25705 [Streptomyces sp. ICC4]AWZ15193.1 hypothetical protein DRB96_26355 [Streptomyces sp. ICC1]